MPVPIIAAIGGIAVKMFSLSALRFFAMKAFVWTMFLTVLPVILYNVISKIMQEIMNYASAAITGQVGTQGIVLQLTGMAAWIFNTMNLTIGISLIFSAIALRFMLNLMGK